MASVLAAAGLLLSACGGGAPASKLPVPPPPGYQVMTPTDVRVTGSTVARDTVAISWTGDGIRTGYEVQWRIADGPWQQLRFLDGIDALPGTSAPLGPDIPIGTRLGFRVRTQLDAEWSDWSAEVTWIRPRVHVFVVPSRTRTGGTIQLEFRGWGSALSATFPDLYLYTGDRLIAPLGQLPWGPVVWDTFSFPEGVQDINLRKADGKRDPELDVFVLGPIEVNRRVQVFWANRSQHPEDVYVPGTPQTYALTIQIEMPDTPVPTVARLWAGDLLVAELGPYPWPVVTWDTSTVPEGAYPVRVEIPGYSPNPPWPSGRTSWNPLVIHVDRTPARITCEVPRMAQAGGWAAGPIRLTASEFVSNQSPQVLVNGLPVGSDYRIVEPGLKWDVIPWGISTPLPFRVSVISQVPDSAGWPSVTECAFDAPAWLSPWGDGPLVVGGEVLVASAFSLEGLVTVEPRTLQATAAWVPAAGTPSAGRLMVARSDGAVFSSGQAVGTAGAIATSVSTSTRWENSSVSRPWVGWTERSAGGPGQVRLASWSGTGWARDPVDGIGTSSRNAKDLALAMGPMADGDGAAVWAEQGGDGSWALAGMRFAGGSWLPVDGTWSDVGVASRESPSLTTGFWGSAMTGYPSMFVTFTETGPGGVPQVRAAATYPGTGWMPVAGVANLDPLVAASDPTAFLQVEKAVAWVEAGRVLARESDRAFAQVTVLNVDPSRRARSPRAASGVGSRSPITVYFVEEGPGGDEIWARRWNGTNWDLLPGPVNAGVPGRVNSLSAKPVQGWQGVLVTWIDDQGHVHARAENR